MQLSSEKWMDEIAQAQSQREIYSLIRHHALENLATLHGELKPRAYYRLVGFLDDTRQPFDCPDCFSRILTLIHGKIIHLPALNQPNIPDSPPNQFLSDDAIIADMAAMREIDYRHRKNASIWKTNKHSPDYDLPKPASPSIIWYHGDNREGLAPWMAPDYTVNRLNTSLYGSVPVMGPGIYFTSDAGESTLYGKHLSATTIPSTFRLLRLPARSWMTGESRPGVSIRHKLVPLIGSLLKSDPELRMRMEEKFSKKGRFLANAILADHTRLQTWPDGSPCKRKGSHLNLIVEHLFASDATAFMQAISRHYDGVLYRWWRPGRTHLTVWNPAALHVRQLSLGYTAQALADYAHARQSLPQELPPWELKPITKQLAPKRITIKQNATDGKSHQAYDIIGDIHGFNDKLVKLLEKMGYTNNNSSFYHPEGRKVIFVGDYIDRGRQSKEVLNTVKRMVDNKTAFALLGNHEYDAICYYSGTSPIPWMDHYQTHAYFGKTIDNLDNEWRELLDWMSTLPLYLDFGNIRAVHACWDQNAIDFLKRDTRESLHLVKDSLNGREYHHHEAPPLTKHILSLTTGPLIGYATKYRKIRWWDLPDYACIPEITVKPIADRIPNDTPRDLRSLPNYKETEPPVFFGHYSLDRGNIKPIKNNMCCVDFKVYGDRIPDSPKRCDGKGPLVAYRWDGEQQLSADKMVWVE